MIKKCLNCGIEFKTTKKNAKCCSRKCSNELKYPKIIVKCEICGKEIKRTESELKKNKHNYCSNECRAKGVGMFQTGRNNPNYKGSNTVVKCSYCNKKIKILNCNFKNSDGSLKQNFYCSQQCKAKHQKHLLKGKNNPNYKNAKIHYKCDMCGKDILISRYRFENTQHNFCSQECKSKYQEIYLTLENNPNYIKKLSEEYRIKYRIIKGYNKWRKDVYKKYNYTCVCCGNKENINTHHLNSYNSDKLNRANIENGVVLCEKCHKKFHSIYGYGNNTKEQFKQFFLKLNKYDNPVVK